MGYHSYEAEYPLAGEDEFRHPDPGSQCLNADYRLDPCDEEVDAAILKTYEQFVNPARHLVRAVHTRGDGLRQNHGQALGDARQFDQQVGVGFQTVDEQEEGYERHQHAQPEDHCVQHFFLDLVAVAVNFNTQIFFLQSFLSSFFYYLFAVLFEVIIR